MNIKKCIAVLAGVAILAGMMALIIPQTVESAECRIIRVYGGSAQGTGEVRLEPQRMMIGANTCVVWVNFANSEIKINFKEGKKCKDGTGAVTGFEYDIETSCYVTSWVPMGGTSSLTFTEQGTYDYEIEWRPGVKDTGQIIVQ